MSSQKHRTSIFSRLAVLALAGALMLTLEACSKESAPAPTEAPTTVSTEAPTEAPTETTAAETQPRETKPKKEFYQVGDKARCGNLRLTYLASGEYLDWFTEPPAGYHCIFLEFAIKNNASNSQKMITWDNFECYADGVLMNWGKVRELWTLQLNGKRTATMRVCFNVPEDAQEINVTFISYDDSDSRAKFVYEGEQDSGQTVELNTEPTPEACQVGQTAETPEFRITCLSCRLDEGYNPSYNHEKPKEGYHYVTCEFEIENISSSGQNLSDSNFTCYADGIYCPVPFDCNIYYDRDDHFSGGAFAGGESATGTLTFMVPDEASVVEVEYLSIFPTSNRVVFDASNPSA